MAIRVLSQSLVNQIAAGEVVERPASAAKELIENSLDADAGRIDVRIEGGGRERLQVVDDGVGIAPADLPLALAPHATSKIERFEDLNQLASFGFRGEAISAIASVAHVTIASRQRASSEAWRIESRFGEVGEARPTGAPEGTAVEVSGLFNNVPARRKFLRSDSAEAARITEVVLNAALAHPRVAFRLESAGRKVIDLAPSPGRAQRAAEVFGESLGERPILLERSAEFEEGHHASVGGLICRPSSMRAVSRLQRIFVNGRPIVDRSLIHAVREAYRGLAEPSMQPVFILFLDVDPGCVDVNVHPQKSEVRWRQPSAMHRIVHRTVLEALRAEDLAVSGVSLLGAPPASDGQSGGAWRGNIVARGTEFQRDPAPSAAHAWVHGLVGEAPPLMPTPSAGGRFLQIDDTWIIFSEGGDLVIVDQHALHERIMFEEIRARVTSGDLLSQQLLVPATCEVPPEALARLDDLRVLFARLGIELAASGPRSLSIHAFPGFLAARRVDPAAFVAKVLASDELLQTALTASDAESKESALAEVLDMMACKAAVKGGDRLSPEEIAQLLEARNSTARSTNCPHGRPTSVRIPIADIERRFGRR